MYIDEVGKSDLGASTDPNHRYLSLTGVIFELEQVSSVVFPVVERLKARYFGSHPDDPVILHRKELVNKKPPFSALGDPAVEAQFNRDLLQLLADLDYVVITAVIDKLEHRRRYAVWRFDPYHKNIAGLQIADLIAHPSFRATLARHENQALPASFGGQIAAILENDKYNRGPYGKIEGWGRKWLP
jgi:hypothetical protein